jgi:hypothetical protein
MSTARKKLILRTEGGDPTEIPAPLLKKIQALAHAQTSDTEFRDIESEEQHLIHYQRRLEAFDKGVHFLLDSMDLAEEIRQQIKTSATAFKEKNLAELKEIGNQISIKPFQATLGTYVKNIKELLIDQALIPKSEVSEAFGRAEEYANLAEGRPALCTITRVKNPENKEYEWMIQMKVPLDPLFQEKKQEFLNIINGQAKPKWFEIMPEIEQGLFLHTFKGAKTTADIARIASTISSKLRSIPGVANFSKNHLIVTDDKEKITTEVTGVGSSMTSSRDIPKDEKALRKEFTTHNIQQIIDAMLEEKVKEQLALGDPNRTRVDLTVLMQTLITPFKEPDKSLYKDKEDAIRALREKSDQPLVITIDGKEIMVNLHIISTNHPLNPGRFITPTGTASDSVLSIKDKDAQEIKSLINLAGNFYEDSNSTGGAFKSAIEELNKQIKPNNKNPPLANQILTELEKKFSTEQNLWIQGTLADPGILKREIATAAAQLKADFPKAKKMHKLLAELPAKVDKEIQLIPSKIKRIEVSEKVKIAATALQKAVERSSWVSDRELYISALEELTTSLMGGISYGSCVSGKDRKGIESLYANAMQRYFDIYNEIPPMSWTHSSQEEAKRKIFVDIFTEMYVTRHQHENAGQNALGADGIKTPHLYLPNDILKAIEKRHKYASNHADTDRLASNNESEKIKNKTPKKIEDKVDLAVLETLKEPDPRKDIQGTTTIMKRLYPRPKEVLEVSKATADQKQSVPPQEEQAIVEAIKSILPKNTRATGVKQMLNLLDKKEEHTTLRELGKICCDREGKKSLFSRGRTKETQELYEMIIKLARNPDSVSGIKILGEKNSAFKLKDTTSSASKKDKPAQPIEPRGIDPKSEEKSVDLKLMR